MNVENIEDTGESLSGGANDIVAVKQADGSYRATPLQLMVGKFDSVKSTFHSREGKRGKIQDNNLHVLQDLIIEIGDSGEAYIKREDKLTYPSLFTSDELESMNLHNGLNEAAFVCPDLNVHMPFSIHLLNQGNKLVLTDIDGTITTSDVRGFVFGTLGFNVHHEGVVELYDKVAKNGYTLIYLSARPLTFEQETRKYLFETLQTTEKGYSLPVSALFLSPVSVVEAAIEASDPSATKTATIQPLLDMFELKEHVVSVGYGNQESDAKSYLNVGIEASKIFIVDEDSKMVNYASGDKTSYLTHAENVNSMYPKISPYREGITDL